MRFPYRIVRSESVRFNPDSSPASPLNTGYPWLSGEEGVHLKKHMSGPVSPENVPVYTEDRFTHQVGHSRDEGLWPSIIQFRVFFRS